MIRTGLLSLSLCLALAQTAGAQAQTGFGAAQDIGAPVEVTADQLQVDQATGLATFSGNVLIGQGAMRLSADRVTVTYAQGNAQKISKLKAEGNVTLASGGDAAEAQAADYDVGSGNVVLTGDVLLTQGANVLAGEKVTVNLKSGTANASGRVRSVLQSGGGN
ncbi:lipopolysaccharide transport periplasmic protein LptA [Paracoccus shanxieyensis]|uniref:Lipopolysaccharide transport periplasmic protein LptA n=1 Tax=Paracoccus shanxieyensis TaxID=2675752 RepID=A0A6L6IT45_9RHOB|nr:lipopolysaccharide transport periplasmic protein LptA [Paracoccus shanxieyensis]MTH63029.1 lipopolysaccharide transport periplasmic protein LptA [Paracoccus shanxieyensis]MTH85887.1 lipopolysaccharide transport periplasmic protein LptA [Paracoccus shanxieyensis]